MTTVGFLGGGRVTRILLGGWVRAGTLPASAWVCEPDDATFTALERIVPDARRAPLEQVASADLVVLALHPPAIPAVLPPLRAALSPHAVLLSLAPKVTLAALAAATGTPRVARMIPNAPSLVGLGYNPVAFGVGLDSTARAELATLFAPWGEAPEVEEADLEAYAILTGMGPTYFWFQWQTLREIAGTLGLSRAATDAALRAAVSGALATLLDSGLEPEAVMDLVPVKPLSGAEAAIVAAYKDTLPALHGRLRPTPAPS